MSYYVTGLGQVKRCTNTDMPEDAIALFATKSDAQHFSVYKRLQEVLQDMDLLKLLTLLESAILYKVKRSELVSYLKGENLDDRKTDKSSR